MKAAGGQEGTGMGFARAFLLTEKETWKRCIQRSKLRAARPLLLLLAPRLDLSCPHTAAIDAPPFDLQKRGRGSLGDSRARTPRGAH